MVGDFIRRWLRAEIAIAVTLALFGVLLLWNPGGLYLWLKALHVIAVVGLWLMIEGGFLRSGWLHAKIVLVVLLSGVHGLLARWTREFAEDRNVHSQRFYRVVNEIPTLLMIGIVILVVVKPF